MWKDSFSGLRGTTTTCCFKHGVLSELQLPKDAPPNYFEKRATSTYLTYRKTLTNRAKNLRTLPTGPWNPGTIFEPLSRVDACTSFAGSAP